MKNKFLFLFSLVFFGFVYELKSQVGSGAVITTDKPTGSSITVPTATTTNFSGVTTYQLTPAQVAELLATAYPGKTMQVSAIGVTLSGEASQAPARNDAYSAVMVSGGTGPYTNELVSGSLPAGLAMVGTNIVGTPTEATNATFTIRSRDANGFLSASKEFTFGVYTYVASGEIAARGNNAYAYEDVLTLVGGTATTNATFTVATLQIASFTISNGGSDYSVSDVLTGDGGASFTVDNVNVGVVDAMTMTAPGSYTGSPGVLSLTGGTGTGCQITETGTEICTVTLSEQGYYTVLPSNPVSVTGGTGEGFTINITWH